MCKEQRHWIQAGYSGRTLTGFWQVTPSGLRHVPLLGKVELWTDLLLLKVYRQMGYNQHNCSDISLWPFYFPWQLTSLLGFLSSESLSWPLPMPHYIQKSQYHQCSQKQAGGFLPFDGFPWPTKERTQRPFSMPKD